MQSVLSTALSRLNAFLDSELEQILCFDTIIDAERLQMIERPLMTHDELKSMPNGHFIVTRTGAYPMRIRRTSLLCFFIWKLALFDDNILTSHNKQASVRLISNKVTTHAK